MTNSTSILDHPLVSDEGFVKYLREQGEEIANERPH